jgi:hypothetical protein
MNGFRRALIRLLRLSDILLEKSISEISKEDQAVEVYAQVAEKEPFIIDDGSGRALVNCICSFGKGDLIRVIGRVTIREGSTMPEIDPFVIRDVSKLDLDLYNELKDLKRRVIIEGRHGK